MEELTNQTFDAAIASGLTLVDFWATWCGPCRMQTPILEELSRELSGNKKIAKVNVDQERDLALKFGIQSIPTILVFQEGRLVDRLVGVRMKDELKKIMNEY
ncbi:thioredoxin [Enterococcus italicus]|uniref:thioredoxin n=1 Tax=Enterococcus italicus TaxID=246144 RepID=UPI00207304A3|nr:thioredoxin [Enterococcus italicus]MCM6932115.1 thioredoxin [Enterococcus italicus]